MADYKKKEQCLKKSNILVYQQPTGKRSERKPNVCGKKMQIPICTPEAKPIKICTGAELRKMCPPKVCPCEPPKRIAKFGLLRFLGFGVKSAIAAGLVYVSYDMGIWGTNEDTQEFYSKACTIFGQPQPKRNGKWDPPSCEAESELFTTPKHSPYGYCDEPPIKAEDTYCKFESLWNNGVRCVFQGISNFPGNVIALINGDKNEKKLKETASTKAGDVEHE